MMCSVLLKDIKILSDNRILNCIVSYFRYRELGSYNVCLSRV